MSTRIDRFLEHARARRETYMRSTCRIVREGGEREWNPATGTYSDPGEIVVYEGKCHLKPTYSPAERDHDSGDREVMIQAYEVIIPLVGTGEVDVGDAVILTKSDDAWAVGKRLPVAWFEHADSRTARHLVVFSQDRPGVKNA